MDLVLLSRFLAIERAVGNWYGKGCISIGARIVLAFFVAFSARMLYDGRWRDGESGTREAGSEMEQEFSVDQRTAQQGDAAAQERLARRYLNGNGVAKDPAKAVFWYRKAADQGNAVAQTGLGWCYDRGAGVEKDPKKAVLWYQKAADQENPVAQSNLGRCYENGTGVERDLEKAVFWYQKSADHDYMTAQYFLGWCYAEGSGVAKDQAKAVFWYQKAADQGHAAAQYNLGQCYRRGIGVAKDQVKAAFWYQKAAEQGQAKAQFWLGILYGEGIGVEKDLAKEAAWLLKAAEQGHADAQYQMGYLFEHGEGVERDPAKAVFWYRKAADQGNAWAQTNLGWCLDTGFGVEKDPTQAVLWYQKAADQGEDTGQRNLGFCYKNGRGVKHDQEKAKYWFRKAADLGTEDAKKQLQEMEKQGTGQTPGTGQMPESGKTPGTGQTPGNGQTPEGGGEDFLSWLRNPADMDPASTKAASEPQPQPETKTQADAPAPREKPEETPAPEPQTKQTDAQEEAAEVPVGYQTYLEAVQQCHEIYGQYWASRRASEADEKACQQRQAEKAAAEKELQSVQTQRRSVRRSGAVETADGRVSAARTTEQQWLKVWKQKKAAVEELQDTLDELPGKIQEAEQECARTTAKVKQMDRHLQEIKEEGDRLYKRTKKLFMSREERSYAVQAHMSYEVKANYFGHLAERNKEVEYARKWVNYLNSLREKQSNAQNNLAAAKRAAEEARQKYQSAYQKRTECEQFADQVRRGNAGLDLALSAACREKLNNLAARESGLRKKIEDLGEQVQALQESAKEKEKTAGILLVKYGGPGWDAMEWILGKKLPPLDENSVRMAGRVFLDRSVGYFRWTFEVAKPSLFALNRSTEEEALVHFISDLWRSYSKTVPGRVLDFSVVDPAGLVRGRIGRASANRMDFVQAYQEGFALRDTEGADESRVRGLFSREDVDALDRELEAVQRGIQNFEREHFAAI